MRTHIVRSLTTLVLTAICQTAVADEFPSRPVKIVVPYAAGGPSDTGARLVQENMSRELGKPVIIENRGGGGGLNGTESFLAGELDGHTMLLGGIAPLTIIPWTRKVSYVTERDFVPIGTVWRSAQTLVVRSSLGVKTMAEFVAYAKANSDKVTIGSAGIGTVSHLGSELLQRVAAIKLIHVPFRSTSESMPQVLGGQIDGLFGDASTVAAQVNAGKAIALGVAAPQRSPALPDTPTIAEAGYPGVEAGLARLRGVVEDATRPRQTPARCVTRRAERSDLSGSAEKAGRDRGRIRPRRVGRADPHRQRQMGCDHHVREYQGRLGTACGE